MLRAVWLRPEELKKARDRRRLALSEASRASGFPEEVLQQWESGDAAPSLDEASDLAQVYRCSLDQFLEPSQEPPRFDLRAHRPMDVDDLERQVQDTVSLFERWCDTAAEIEELAGRRTIRLQQMSDAEPTAMSTSLRQEFGVEDRPIGNIRRLIEEEMGTLVFSFPCEGLSGISWWHPKAGPAMLVNRNDSKGRQNWTSAHELGHLLQGNAVVLCDTMRTNHSEPRERSADRFAAEFLMPATDLRGHIARSGLGQLLDRDETLQQIAIRYRVSREALSRRLEEFGFLPRGFTNDRLPDWLAQMPQPSQGRRRSSRRKQRVRELGEGLVNRAIKAYEAGSITLSKLAEELDLGVVEAESLVHERTSGPGSG